MGGAGMGEAIGALFMVFFTVGSFLFGAVGGLFNHNDNKAEAAKQAIVATQEAASSSVSTLEVK